MKQINDVEKFLFFSYFCSVFFILFCFFVFFPNFNQKTSIISVKGQEIVIYYDPFCPHCDSALRFFEKNEIKYIGKNVRDNIDLREEMFLKSNSYGVPQIYIGDKFLLGWDKDKFLEML